MELADIMLHSTKISQKRFLHLAGQKKILLVSFNRITDYFDVLPSCGGSAIDNSPPASIDTVILNIHDHLWEQQDVEAQG